MTQGQHLKVQRDARPHQPRRVNSSEIQNGYHREQSLSIAAEKFNSANMYGVFSSHRRDLNPN
jgi:hypothetical protein